MTSFVRSFVLALFAFLVFAPQASAQIVQRDRFVGVGYELQTAKLNLINKGTDAIGRPVNSEDHIFYNPATGDVVIGITNHPQVSGFNGTVAAPGDCYANFDSGVVGATNVKIGDFDGDGTAQELILYRASDGKWKEFRIELTVLFPGCDTSDSF